MNSPDEQPIFSREMKVALVGSVVTGVGTMLYQIGNAMLATIGVPPVPMPALPPQPQQQEQSKKPDEGI